MINQEKKQSRLVVIVVWNNRAYLPTLAIFESGIYVNTEPVYVVDLTIEDLTKAIQAVKDAGHEILPSPKTREEFLARKSPMLTATGARSWKKLTKKGINYSIDWTENQIRIDMSRLDKKGRWENDPNKVRIFPPDTLITEIIETILEDIKTRPKFSEKTNRLS